MTTAQEFKRQMSIGQKRGSTVAQRASETIVITRTDYTKKKPKFLLMLGVWFIDENGALRQPTVDELLEHFQEITT